MAPFYRRGMRIGLIYTIGVLAAAAASGPAGDFVPTSHVGAYTANAAAHGAAGPGSGPGGIERAPDGLFYTDGVAGTASLRFLIDTGASHVVLSHSDARAVRGRKLTGRTNSIRTAGGSVQVEWILIDRLQVAGSTLDNVEAAVPEKDVGTSLLGQNALARFSRIEINADRLVLDK